LISTKGKEKGRNERRRGTKVEVEFEFSTVGNCGFHPP
jgi:hypothetical protein